MARRDFDMVSSNEMQPRTVLAFGSFLLAISATLINYVLLSYLASFIPTAYLGFTVAAGAALTIASLPFLPDIVARYGAQKIVFYLVFTEMLLLFAVAGMPHTVISASFVVLVLSLQPLIYYALDLLLEATIDGDNAGSARTFFLTGGNTGAIIAPLIIGILLANTDNYTTVFFAAALSSVLFIILFSARQLPKNSPPTLYRVRDTLVHIARHRDLAAVTVGHFILYLFYMWASFYIPLYLHSVLGIPWSTLGWMFSLVLIPYILIEYPAGWLADKVFGDKEMMFVGFIMAGLALASVSTLTATSSLTHIFWTLIIMRAGAALIESMTEGHFFRRVSQQDIVSVSVFRGVWPFANIVAPIVASLILFFGDYQILFILTGGFIAIAGAGATLFIKDFR